MIIIKKPHLLAIDFGRSQADWALLVVDDRWDHVSRMVCGNPAVADVPGLGADCVNSNKVDEYWQRRPNQDEPLIKALLMLPQIACNEQTIGKIMFTPFPQYLPCEDIKQLLDNRLHIAAMIDVMSQESGQEIGMFAETWKKLDTIEAAPSFARCIFTRGGVDASIPHAFKKVPRVLKANEYDWNHYRDVFDVWWKIVQGDLENGAKLFHDETTGDIQTTEGKVKGNLHKPSRLPDAGVPAIKKLLAKMAKHDTYGVWQWCESEFVTVDLPFQRKWHAAKALQTCGPQKLPVAGLIALVYGLNVKAIGSKFVIETPFESIPKEKLDEVSLGTIPITKGTSKQLMDAIRTWVNHVEHFDAGHARVAEITVTANNGLKVSIKHSGKVPDAVINPPDRKGNVHHAFTKLIAFARTHHWDASNSILTIEFEYEC
jgi:hypothetical protein